MPTNLVLDAQLSKVSYQYLVEQVDAQTGKTRFMSLARRINRTGSCARPARRRAHYVPTAKKELLK